MKRKLFFGLLALVSVTACVMVAVLSCKHRMDIKNFVEDELARDRTELVVTYYTDATKTNKYEAPALVTDPADKPNTTVYLPSGKTIYAEVPVENKRELDLQAYIKLDNPSDAQFFDTLDGSTPYFEDVDGERRHTIAAEDIVTNDGKATITFPLNFKATHDNATTAEGKSVPVTLVIERIVEGGGTPFSEKKLTIACNSPPPALKDVQLVKAKNGNDIYLVCNIDESPKELSLRHRDLQRIVIGPYSIEITAGGNTTKIEEQYTGSFDFGGTTPSNSSPQFSYALDASEYQLFGNKGEPTNITTTSLAYNLNVSAPTSFNLAVALQDSAHMQGEAKTTNGTLYKLAAPTVTDAIKDSIIQSSGVGGQNEIFIGINGSNQGQLTVDALDTVYAQGYGSDPIDNLKNIITVKTKLAKATAYGESPTYDTPSESSDTASKTFTIDTENLYHLQVQAQAPGYLDSDLVDYYVTMQKTVYVDSSNGDDDNNGLKNNPLKTITKAIERAKILIPYTKNDDNITCYLSGNFNENDLDTSLFDKNKWTHGNDGRNNSLVLTKMPGEAQNPTIQGITIGQNTKVSDINFASNLTIADNQPFNITLTNVTFEGCGISLNSSSTSTYVSALNLENVIMSGGDSGTGVNITDMGLENLKINIKTTTIEKFETGINLSTGSTVTIENSTIQNCKRGIKVQGLNSFTATLTLTDTTIQNCNTTTLTSDNQGAGIYMENFSSCKIDGDSKIINNTTKNGSGAGIYVKLSRGKRNVLEICGNTIINGNKILSCTQSGGGAGIYNQGLCYIYGNACIGDPNATTAATERTNFDSLSGNYVQAATKSGSKEYVYGGGIYNAGFLYLGARPSGDTEVKDGCPKVMGNYCEGQEGLGQNTSGGGGIYHFCYGTTGNPQNGSMESEGMFAIYDCVIRYNGHPNEYRNGIYIDDLCQDIVYIKSSGCQIYDNVFLDAYGYRSSATSIYYYVGNINMGLLTTIRQRIHLYLSSYISAGSYDMVKKDAANATLPGALFLAKKEGNSPTNIVTNDTQWQGKTDK